MVSASTELASADRGKKAHPSAPGTPSEASKAPAADQQKAEADAKDADAKDGDAKDGDAEAAEANPLDSIPHIVGPKQVNLGFGSQIDLPEGMILFEKAQAQDLLQKMGNDAEGTVALILPPQNSGANWLIAIEGADVGYVSDDDADELDADELLNNYKEGTKEQNKKRVTMGVAELFVDGWTERPRYERAKHHLVWGLDAHDVNGKVVNFFTRFLGRNGFLSVNLIDDPATIEKSKVQALSVLDALHFAPGSRYEDHIDSDRDSGMGLKALVLGGTGVVIAKKTGILVAILLVLKKGFIVVLAAIGGFFKWLFGRGKKNDGDVTPSGPPPDSGTVG